MALAEADTPSLQLASSYAHGKEDHPIEVTVVSAGLADVDNSELLSLELWVGDEVGVSSVWYAGSVLEPVAGAADALEGVAQVYELAAPERGEHALGEGVLRFVPEPHFGGTMYLTLASKATEQPWTTSGDVVPGRGGVFTEDMIKGYIDLKRGEVERLNMTTHPVEFDLYYSC